MKAKLMKLLKRMRYKGSLMTLASGVLLALVAFGVITEQEVEALTSKVEYVLGLGVALGLIRLRKEVKTEKESK